MIRFLPKRMRPGAVVLAFLLLALPRSARADEDKSLDEARYAVEASDYLTARTALTTALGAGTAGPVELAEIYKLSGIVEAALGDATAAQTAFSKWLALDPRAALPAGTSPKITRPFTAATTQAKKRESLKVKTETATDPPSVTLVIVSDPLKLVSRARVEVSADGKPERTLEGAGTDRITIALPKGRRLDLRVQALDEHGNRVVELGSSDVPIVVITNSAADVVEPAHQTAQVKAPKREEAPPQARPLWAKWWLWGSVAVAFAGGATYFGVLARADADQLRTLNATSQDHSFTEAQDTATAGQRDALLFNIGMGAAGVLALGSAILYLTEPRVATETRVGAVPVRGGGAIVLGGHF